MYDAYHTHRFTSDSQNIVVSFHLWITYLLLHETRYGLSEASAIWQQFFDKVFEIIPNWERFKVIMDDLIILLNV